VIGLGALAALPIARASESQQSLYLWLAALAIAALGVAVALGWSVLVPASLVIVSGVYAVQLTVDDAGLDASVAPFAAGLYLTAEFAYWSLEERAMLNGDPGEGLRRLAIVAMLGITAFVVAVVLVALADVVRARGLALDLLGAAAAASALLAVLLAARDGGRTGE
jgi:fucose 4-O-acetylase-like acetyltransferase